MFVEDGGRNLPLSGSLGGCRGVAAARVVSVVVVEQDW